MTRPLTQTLHRIALGIALVLVLATAVFGGSAQAQETPVPELISRLAGADFGETEAIVEALAATGDPAVAAVLEALGEGDLYYRRADNAVFIAKRGGAGYLLTDPVTGESAGEAGRRDVIKVRVNNSLRRTVRSAIGTLTLRSPDPAVRRSAAEAALKSRDPEGIEALTAAIEAEGDAGVRLAMERARAAAILNSDADIATKITAVDTISLKANRIDRAS